MKGLIYYILSLHPEGVSPKELANILGFPDGLPYEARKYMWDLLDEKKIELTENRKLKVMG